MGSKELRVDRSGKTPHQKQVNLIAAVPQELFSGKPVEVTMGRLGRKEKGAPVFVAIAAPTPVRTDPRAKVVGSLRDPIRTGRGEPVNFCR
jgi:hypothetical protein